MPSLWLFSRSLIYPLTAVLVALAVLPVGLAGWGFVSTNREQVATLEKQVLTRQSAGLAREIELFYLRSADRIGTVALALGQAAPEPRHGSAPPQVLRDLMQANGDIVLLRLLDVSGQGPFVQDQTLSESIEKAMSPLLDDAFAANLQGRAVRRDLVEVAGGKPVALVSLPLLSASGEVQGSLQGVVSLSRIEGWLTLESSPGVTVDVVDRQGVVLFSSERRRVGRPAAGHPLVEQFLSAPVRLTMSYADPWEVQNDEVLGSLCPVEGLGWAVVSARKMNVAFAALRAMAQRTVLLGVATALVAMIAGVGLARRITLPLRRLAEVTSAMAEGDYARRVSVTTHNELGQLAANFNVMAGEVEQTITSLRRALQENQELLVDSIRALAAAIDAKSPYTRGHSERVSTYAVAIAQQLGLEAAEVRNVEISALLHDVGKIGIEDAILQKPEALTESEFAQMRAHSLKGSAIVSSIKRLRDLLPGIRSHHENWSGGGYPDGLAGEEIPLVARIIAAADVFDAMTTNRPYQQAMGVSAALARLRELSGKRLDPRVVEAVFLALRAGDLVPLGSVEVA